MTTTTQPTREECYWCGRRDGLTTYVNGWDNDAGLTLCDECMPEPDACAEHTSGCNGRTHTWMAEAQ